VQAVDRKSWTWRRIQLEFPMSRVSEFLRRQEVQDAGLSKMSRDLSRLRGRVTCVVKDVGLSMMSDVYDVGYLRDGLEERT